MISPRQTHPNATRSAETTGATVFLTWLAGHLGFDLSAEAAVFISGAAITVALFVGREGIRGAWRRLLDGEKRP